jgi:hypothetical protein
MRELWQESLGAKEIDGLTTDAVSLKVKRHKPNDVTGLESAAEK